VQQVEETMQRAFAGVRRPRSEVVATAGGGGVMPRAYLLGNAPELYETVVFTATVNPPAAYGAGYWRGLSYDVYTGRGWALSNERSEPFDADERLPTLQGQRVLTQTVQRHTVDPQVRYTLGYPRTFADPVTVYWRGVDDFSRASAPGAAYTATTTLLATDPADLRRANDAPDLVLARYTNLPDEIPRRVLDLAQDVTATTDNDYDRARALETFLRQYPYSLEVDPPPSGRDPVDFFLFDLQRGYCDYYASSMVVMARSVGLPARLVVGYRAQPPDELGAQTIYQINAHAWVEVYFDGDGWVTFEPTAAFPTDTQVVEEGDPLAINEATPAPPALPPAPGAEPSVAPWLSLLLLVVLVAAWVWWLRRPRRAADGDTLVWAYERLQQQARRLGQPTPPSQTPAEFGAAFRQRLSAWADTPRFGSLLRGARPAVERLVSLYMRRQYSRPQTGAGLDPGPRRDWQRLLRRLWLFGALKRLLRRPD
jgi:transglutaminase-like putative cysteine protease